MIFAHGLQFCSLPMHLSPSTLFPIPQIHSEENAELRSVCSVGACVCARSNARRGVTMKWFFRANLIHSAGKALYGKGTSVSGEECDEPKPSHWTGGGTARGSRVGVCGYLTPRRRSADESSARWWRLPRLIRYVRDGIKLEQLSVTEHSVRLYLICLGFLHPSFYRKPL